MHPRATLMCARTALVLCTSLLSTGAIADWHAGKITQLGVEYDGSTVAFKIEGWNRSNCTCAPSWPNQMCLNHSRPSFKEEYAWLLSARRTQQVIQVNINETTCNIVATFEVD